MSKKPIFNFQKNFSLEERKNESERIKRECPSRVPVIVEVAPNSKEMPPLKKNKYLVPYDMTINQFHFLIRRSIDLTSESALYLITNGISLSGSKTMGEVYNNLRDKTDNFLYVFCASEITMG